MSAVREVALLEVAEINPALDQVLPDDEPVSFLPMSGVDPDHVHATGARTRLFGEVKKGYTPFVNGDVLVAKITPCFENGKIAQAILPHRIGFGSTEFHVVRPHAAALEARYLVHYLRQEHVRRAGERKMTGSAGQRRVPEHFLANLRIPLPPLLEQRRIAAILDKADALRAKRRAALEKLDELTQAIFLDMFGDPVTNPMGWEIVSIGDLAEVQGGLQLSSYRKSLPREVPYLRVANVYRNRLDLREIKKLRATDTEIARTALMPGDLLVVEGHGNAEEIGRSALWDGSIENCVHQNHLIRVRFDRARINPLYASYFLNSDGGRRHLLRSGKTTSGLNTINVSQVRVAPIAVPPIDLQRRFSCVAEQIDRLRHQLTVSSTAMFRLFTALQDGAFRGELCGTALETRTVGSDSSAAANRNVRL